MKKIISFIFIITLHISAFSQSSSNLDLRFGIGSSFLGSGDFITTMVETELNYKKNKFLTLGSSIAFPKSDYGAYENASFFQINANGFLSPFKNNKRNDFRFGGGLTLYNVSDSYISSEYYVNNILIDRTISLNNRKTVGTNLIIENTYAVTNKLLVGIKLFTQQYINGDINSGVMLKLGVNI